MFKNTISILHNKKQSFTIYALLVILWMIVIFYFSAQPATTSSSMSNGVIEWLKQLLPFDLQQMNNIQLFVRKSAHFFEYACLGFLCYQMFSQLSISKYAGRCATVLSFLYACSDELHQLFVPGRAGMWQDVILDTTGAMFAVFFIICINQIFNKGKPKS